VKGRPVFCRISAPSSCSMRRQIVSNGSTI
jgi:hypothetical protein